MCMHWQLQYLLSIRVCFARGQFISLKETNCCIVASSIAQIMIFHVPDIKNQASELDYTFSES
jgi:hypothetical protein